ncbi:hypothetical protein GW915_05985 [bacterium]|nr:hypothetical protein [bacterium]
MQRTASLNFIRRVLLLSFLFFCVFAEEVKADTITAEFAKNEEHAPSLLNIISEMFSETSLMKELDAREERPLKLLLSSASLHVSQTVDSNRIANVKGHVESFTLDALASAELMELEMNFYNMETGLMAARGDERIISMSTGGPLKVIAMALAYRSLMNEHPDFKPSDAVDMLLKTPSAAGTSFKLEALFNIDGLSYEGSIYIFNNAVEPNYLLFLKKLKPNKIIEGILP